MLCSRYNTETFHISIGQTYGIVSHSRSRLESGIDKFVKKFRFRFKRIDNVPFDLAMPKVFVIQEY